MADHPAPPTPSAPRLPDPPPPVAFHRIAHGIGARRLWYRPLVALAVSVAVYGAMALPLIFAAVIVADLTGRGISDSLSDPLNPLDQILGLGSLALMLPAVLLGTLAAYGRARWSVSVLGRFRWGLLGRAALVIVPLYVLVNSVLSLVLARDQIVVPPATGMVVLAWVLAVAISPLQSAAEEFAFRSLPQQMLGTWLRHPAWGILLPVPLFVIGHGYDALGLTSVALFAVTMGLLAWKTGGIELPILLHAANNTTLFAVAPLIPGFTEQGEVTWTVFLVSTVPLLASVAGIWWWFSRREHLRFGEPLRARLGRGAASPAETSASSPATVPARTAAATLAR